jgi:hypothetical protein
MRKGFTFIELLIAAVIVIILGAIAFGAINTNTGDNPNEPTRTVEVVCPMTMTTVISDTVPDVIRYDYLTNELSVWRKVNDGLRSKTFPMNCVVREVTNGF